MCNSFMDKAKRPTNKYLILSIIIFAALLYCAFVYSKEDIQEPVAVIVEQEKMLGGATPLTIQDDFEARTLGDLNGQGAWVGSAAYDVETGVSNSGSKAVELYNPFGTWPYYMDNTFTEQTDGAQVFYVMTTQLPISSADGIQLWITDGGAYAGRLGAIQWRMSAEPNIYLASGGADVGLVTTALTNTWYKFEIQWRSSDGKIRARVNDGTFTDWQTKEHNWTAVDNFKFNIGGENSSAGYFYFDDFSDPNYTPAAAYTDPPRITTWEE